MSEVLQFTMHPKMLLDIIERQAGTLEKAVLEAGMNSIEANASYFNIDFSMDDNHKRLVMTDNGCGIKTRQELEEHFRQFGTPHKESENKKWAQFRMGRGQCFAQGKNIWRTGNWQMKTDIRADVKADRLPEFHLTKHPNYHGCRIDIELYDDKYYGNIERLKDLVTEQLEFVTTDVNFNGTKVNRDPRKLKWTVETDDAYFLFGVGQDMIIYNLGVKVQKIPASRAGVVGIVVSKKQLKVNFARNEVLSDCPIMGRISEIIKQNRIKKTRKQRRLDSYERVAALADLRDGIQGFDNLKTIGLFYTTSGRSLTFRDILNNRIPWTFASEGDIIADKLMQSEQALCIDDRAVKELNYNGNMRKFFTWLSQGQGRGWNKVEAMYRPFADLNRNFSKEFTFVPNKKWTKLERRLIRVLEGLHCWNGRAFVIGLSDSSRAWTDGRSYIAIERTFLRQSHFSSCDGAARFLAVMIHELAHDEDTTGSHIHGEQFYRNFHNIIVYGSAADSGANKYDGGGPFRYLELFASRMKRAVADEHAAEAVKRELKAKARVKKALGGEQTHIAALIKTSTNNAPVFHKKRRIRRMPRSAE